MGAEAGAEVVRMGAGLSGTVAAWRELETGLEKKRSGCLGFAKARASLFFLLVLCLPTQFQAREIRVGVQL